MYKETLGAIAIALTIIAFFPYIRDTIQGKIKPHVFSWVIWGLTTSVVFLAQWSDKGGAGSWAIGVSGMLASFVALLAYLKKADITITRLDWILFIIAITAIPFWYITSDPLWAVVILTSVDIIGFIPTIRKAYWDPFEEQILLPAFIVTRNIFTVMAMENYSLTTLLFPVAISIAALILIMVIMLRRYR